MAMTGASETADEWVSQAVLNVGRPQFHANLLMGLHEAIGADHISHLSYDRDGCIQHAQAASLRDQSMIDWTTDVYVKRLYRRDPNYPLVCSAAQRGGPDGWGVQMLSSSPESIVDAEYRRLLFETPGFASKVSLIGAWGDHTCYLNLYFSRTVIESRGISALMRSQGRLLMALALRHDELMYQGHAPAPVVDEFSGLSLRERQVADLLLQGHTIKEVGRALALSPTTVVTYKNRVFEKLEVVNLRDFLRRARVSTRPQ
jgi:DNA-binding CsgD family transcriptional regulator